MGAHHHHRRGARQNHCIRRVDAPTRIISTIVGMGTAGSTGDGGTATIAQLNGPTAIAVDPLGDILIADQGNHRVRKLMVAEGVLVAFAGTGTAGNGGSGVATTIALNNPYGIAVDLGTGNVYIADTFNHVVRFVNVTTSIIVTVAGIAQNNNGGNGPTGDGGPATSATLNRPRGLALNGGQLYICDDLNNRVRVLNVASGTLLTFAGVSYSGYIHTAGTTAVFAPLWNPYSIAFDAMGDAYIASTSAHCIMRVAAVTTIASTAAGICGSGCSAIGAGGLASATGLCYPTGVAFDAANNLYIADEGNNVVRVVSREGSFREVEQPDSIDTVAGGGAALTDGVAATVAALSQPFALAYDAPSGTLAITENAGHRVRLVNGSGAIVTLVGTGIAGFSGDGGQATAAQLNGPEGVTPRDSSGAFYIGDAVNNRVRKVSANGIISTVAGNGAQGYGGDNGQATAAALCFPAGVAWASGSSSLYIADQCNSRIRRVSGGIIITVAGTGTSGFAGKLSGCKDAEWV